MGKVVERTKKKKGRPSLLDLQKRTIKEQQQQQQQQQKQNPNPNFKTSPITPNPHRRSTRRNPNPELVSPEDDNTDATGEDDDDDELKGKRREKKLKLVLKLPSRRSSLNSASPNSGSYCSDSNAENDAVGTNHKKRKINAIGDGSGHGDSEKAGKHVSASNSTNTIRGTQLDVGPSTPLPDKKLLFFVLDRLQKKDTYGVFSEPVDPKELPDYHEVIDHPMDFGTVRKNLGSGAYADLEQFEKDVYLICSNAMQYNAPDTIYFRQARSIQELAKKNFENLRQDSDDNEPERKIVRRGRPPIKNLRKQIGRPPLERAGSEFSSDATLANGAENSTWSNFDTRKGPLSDKSGPADFLGRSLHGSRNGEAYTGWLAEQKSDRNHEFTGSMSRGNWMKNGRKQVVHDESRRNTYMQSHLSAGAREPSVLTTFDGERKQLMAVGLPTELGYARSLARFAANLGPVAWTVASKKIEKSLPAGVKFGPGWVGENEAVPQRLPLFPSPPTVLTSLSQPSLLPGNSSAADTPSAVEIKSESSSESPEMHNLSEKLVPSTHSALDRQASKPFLSSAPMSSSPIAGNKTVGSVTESAEAVRGMNSHANFNMTSGSVGKISTGPPFRIHQNSVIYPGMNGFNGAYGLNLPVQMRKLIGSVRPTGIDLQSSRYIDSVSRNNTNLVHPVTTNCLNSEDSKLLESTSRINSSCSLPDSGCEVTAPRTGLHPRPYRQEESLQHKQESVPPDLNVRFQSPGSPASTRVDSTQPDLALQL